MLFERKETELALEREEKATEHSRQREHAKSQRNGREVTVYTVLRNCGRQLLMVLISMSLISGIHALV